MKDLYFTETGDFTISSNGDIAVTQTDEEQISQQAMVRIVTQKGDFTIYPNFGTSLQKLVGKPNTKDTASFGAALIRQALTRDNLIKNVYINSYPTSNSTIAFEVNIAYGQERNILLTLEQSLV